MARLPDEVREGRVNSRAILQKAGEIALDHVKRAFLTKSKGGTDEAGDRWKPLLPETIAYSRRVRGGKGRTKPELARNARPSQALNKKQQSRWWDLYRQGLRMFKGDKSHAARRAWFILKGEGATTLFDKYSHEKVDILYDTGELFGSIVMKVEKGEIVIKATADHAAPHHYGVPGRTPQRRLWPEPNKWPSSWWENILTAIQDEFVSLVANRARDM